MKFFYCGFVSAGFLDEIFLRKKHSIILQIMKIMISPNIYRILNACQAKYKVLWTCSLF